MVPLVNPALEPKIKEAKPMPVMQTSASGRLSTHGSNQALLLPLRKALIHKAAFKTKRSRPCARRLALSQFVNVCQETQSIQAIVTLGTPRRSCAVAFTTQQSFSQHSPPRRLASLFACPTTHQSTSSAPHTPMSQANPNTVLIATPSVASSQTRSPAWKRGTPGRRTL